MAAKRKKNPPPASKRWLLWVAFVLPIVAVVALIVRGVRIERPPSAGNSTTPPAPQTLPTNSYRPPEPEPDQAVFARYGKSPSCKACHEEAYELWKNSHHALAERPVQISLDSPAFEPAQRIRHGSQSSEARKSGDTVQLLTTSLEGTRKPFTVERVLGVDPLRQYLIAAPGGRLQASELVFDPHHASWLDVYGEEDRQAGEWGHWTGRGMTWNSMCATCHNTRLRKNYREQTDSYQTSMAEMGIGCESCHGPMEDHNAWQAKHPNQSNDPTLRPVNREQMFAVCASCHSRRAELTGEFQPGQTFLDHFSLNIPDDSDLFYPDGQIRDEVYEFNVFRGSRMHDAGVRCTDCHEPHSGKTRIAGNNLCMICHAGPAPPAPKIDPATHSHHVAGGRGDQCVACHMPQTVYMQRHARHDHGFTVPDPVLTKELNIPNACNRCHLERTPDWSIEAIEKWYGPRTNRPARARTQLIAKARADDRGAVPGLLGMLRSETNSLWRAASANLLRRWIELPNVTAALLSSAGDPDPLVRAMSVRALEPHIGSGNQPVQMALQNRLTDPVRVVRIDAAWALRASLETNTVAGTDLLNYLRFNADQPMGALQQGVFHLDREDTAQAIGYFQRAVSWDTNSAPTRHALAVALSLQGRSQEAVDELRAACRLAPRDAEFRFKLGLALSDVGRIDDAREALEQAVKLDPQFAQAWYNLGLAYNRSGKPEPALDSLLRAESIDGYSAQIPYARATILARLGRVQEARKAARRALEIQPGHREAAGLLESLPR